MRPNSIALLDLTCEVDKSPFNLKQSFFLAADLKVVGNARNRNKILLIPEKEYLLK